MKRKIGEIFDLNKQCKIAFGAHYGLCRVLNFNCFRKKSFFLYICK